MFLGLVFTSSGWGLVARKTTPGLEAWNFQLCPATSGERRQTGRGLKSSPMTSNWIIILSCNGTSIKTPEQWCSGSFHVAEDIQLLEGGTPEKACKFCVHCKSPGFSVTWRCWAVSSIINWWFSSKESACQCRRCRFNPWVEKVPWEGNGHPLQHSWTSGSSWFMYC